MNPLASTKKFVFPYLLFNPTTLRAGYLYEHRDAFPLVGAIPTPLEQYLSTGYASDFRTLHNEQYLSEKYTVRKEYQFSATPTAPILICSTPDSIHPAGAVFLSESPFQAQPSVSFTRPSIPASHLWSCYIRNTFSFFLKAPAHTLLSVPLPSEAILSLLFPVAVIIHETSLSATLLVHSTCFQYFCLLNLKKDLVFRSFPSFF